MDRTERFYKIDQLLKERKVVSFAALQEALDVSRATLRRDLDYMRERLHAPIEYDRDANGYRFGKPRAGPRYELPGLWFSADEIHALLTTLQLLTNLQPGLLDGQVSPLVERLRAILGQGRSLVAGDREPHPHLSARATGVQGSVFQRHRGGAAQANSPVDSALQPQRGPRDRARGVAAAAGALSRQLVPRCVLPPSTGSAELRRRRDSRRRAAGQRRRRRFRKRNSTSTWRAATESLPVGTSSGPR